MTWILIAIAGACVQLVVAEVFDWFPWISAKIIRFAAASLPDRFGARWEAEWLAELDAIPGKGISKMLFALSVLRGVPRLRVTLDPAAPRLRTLIGARGCDCAFAAIGLLVFLPLFLAVALAVRLFLGPGPAFYRSFRVGPNGEMFILFKFRTRPFQTSRELDAKPRVGLVGQPLSALLRSTGLGELPSLINVLRGEMSLVGPRPTLPTDRKEEPIAHAKPGI